MEFDATIIPINMAYKVHYTNNYPEAIYPSPTDVTAFIPALVKSDIWIHEEEFRTIFVPWSNAVPPNDGESLILKDNVVKNVYFGSNIDEDKKGLIIDLIKNGGFNPGIWVTSLTKSNFSLEFVQVG